MENNLEKKVDLGRVLLEIAFSHVDRKQFVNPELIELEQKLNDESWRDKEKLPQLSSVRAEIENTARAAVGLPPAKTKKEFWDEIVSILSPKP